MGNILSLIAVTGKTGGTTPGTVQPVEVEKEGKDPDFDQCGLDPDPEGLWEDDPGEPRIKESLLTPEEKIKFRALVDRIFHPDCVKGVRLLIKPDDLIEVADKVIPYLASEPMLIEDLPFDISIVADLHGQLHDLYRVFKGDERDGKPGWENMKYVFLGDYVDRGRQSLEVVLALFCLKMLYPDRIFLLRGNHEFVSVNARYGFIMDFVDRFDDETCDILFFKINEVFCWLSVAAIVGNSYLCVHGGISPSIPTRDHLLSIEKPILQSRQDSTAFNAKRKASCYFGLDELASALYNLECTGIFRGHTKNNDGAIAVLDAQGKVTMRILECNPARVAWIKKLKARDAECDSYDSDGSDDGVTVDSDGSAVSDDDFGPMLRV